MTTELTRAEFVRELRHVLYRLYDPQVLRRSTLAALLGLDGDRSSLQLQGLLLNAIQALEPDSRLSPYSDAARTHAILSHRFVDQFDQREVANTLGLSVRQMQREERIALQVLADYIVERFNLRLSAATPEGRASSAGAGPADEVDASTDESELRWIQEAYPSQILSVAGLLNQVLELAAPVAESLGVHIDCHVASEVPDLLVQEMSLRQALLNALAAVARSAPGGSVRVRAAEREQHVCITIGPVGSTSDSGASPHLSHALEMAHSLAELSGGCVDLVHEPATPCSEIRFALPRAEQVVVLAMDDNVDTLQLLQRYLSGTRYHLVGVREPERMLAVAEELTPSIVLLDVMLPGVDGWELLGRLREHPTLGEAPIVVCTILPMEQFALTLGAAAFIRKPVTQDGLLALLDRLTARPSPAS